MRTRLLILAAGLMTVVASGSALAHHGRASYSNEIITLDATVTEFRFVNPHVQIYFTVVNEAGETEQWQSELTAPNKLARGGWTKNMFQPGDQVQITGRAARNDGKSVAISEIIMPDGRSLPIFEVIDVPLY